VLVRRRHATVAGPKTKRQAAPANGVLSPERDGTVAVTPAPQSLDIDSIAPKLRSDLKEDTA
jgi:hypothetical protein